MGGCRELMIDYLQWSVEELFQKAASSEPEPGGGGVSAMTGCLGAGMLIMVARITLDKEKDTQRKEALSVIIETLEQNVQSLKTLTQRDMDAYQGFMDALAMPKKTPEEKALRENKKEQAAVQAANIPLEIAKTCHHCLQVAVRLAELGSKYAISDVGAGAFLLEGALKASLLMVEANLAYINDSEKIKDLVQQKEHLILEAEELGRFTLETVRQRMI